MKIVSVMFKYDYGIKSRGDSFEKTAFHPALEALAEEVYPFWFDEYSSNKEELQKQLINFVDFIQPDLVFFVLFRDQFTLKTLDYLKDRYITVNWFCDDQWRFDDFTRNYAPHFTYSVTTDRFSLAKYRSIGVKNAILSQWATFDYLENFDLEGVEYKYDVSFVGGFSGNREWTVKMLAKMGIEVTCFGAGWANGRVALDEMKEIFKNSKVNLNLSNSVCYDIRCILSSPKAIRQFFKSKKNREQVKARHFEIPAFGGFQLTNYVPFLEDYFVIGSEIAVYATLEELYGKIRYYLENDDERRRILVNGYNRTKKHGTYYGRLKEVINIIKMDGKL